MKSTDSGMSRAAKKRAKKRAKAVLDNEPGVTDEAHANQTKKIKLPMNGSDDGSGKRKKSKKKNKASIQKDDALGSVSAVPPDEEETITNERTQDANEMPAELEELLSTLTPKQILLLDEVDEKPSPDGELNRGELDPLQIIGDLTTQSRSKVLLSSIINPSSVTTSEFYNEHWGKKPLVAAFDESFEEKDETILHQYRQHLVRFDGFLNRVIIDEMIRKNKLRYGLDLNITRYTDSMGNGMKHRLTLDPPPKQIKKKKSPDDENAGKDLEYVVANPKDVWSNVDSSQCTLRLLRPHEHNERIHTMLSLLESEFGCMVGSNAYMTPLNSQGFAPHYDDVDVFILQLEGFKRWRVYAPFNKAEILPRKSSSDYTEKEVEEMGEEEVDMVLGPGDVLYLPRGWIHQAETVARPHHIPEIQGVKDDHSLHLTVSAMQNWSWADFLELLIPEALEGAAASDKSISLREGLPVNFLSYMGTMHSQEADASDLPEGLKQVIANQKTDEDNAADASGDDESKDGNPVSEDALSGMISKQKKQNAFKEEARKRIMRVCKQAMSMLDDACDQIGIRFLSDRLPPALLKPEALLTKESSTTLLQHDATKKIWPNTLCRLVRPNIARLVIEDAKAVIYHCLDNSLIFHENPLCPMEFEIDDAPALEQLLTTVEPHWIMVKDLIHGDVEDKMEIAQALYDEGLLATMLMNNPDSTDSDVPYQSHGWRKISSSRPDIRHKDHTSSKIHFVKAMAKRKMSSKIPVTVLTGFLGSGKTTLLNHILSDSSHGMKFAIIENEFGEIGVDEKILLETVDEEVVEVMNGCICCTVRGDLVEALKKLHKKIHKFDGVIIETTGLADPAPVVQTFFIDEDIQEKYSLDAVITVVDAKNIRERLAEEKPEGVENESVEQVCFADKILLNKTDLADEKTLTEIEGKIKKLNPSALIIRCQYSKVNPKELLNIDAFNLKRVLDFEPDFLSDDQEHQHDQSVSSVSCRVKGNLNQEMLMRWISRLIQEDGANLYRYKGVLSVKGMSEKFVFQGVGMLFDGAFASGQVWTEPEAERESVFVFIGKNLKGDWLKECFKKCLVNENLRFKVGDAVQANVGQWKDGIIKACWDEGNAYRVEIKDAKKTNVWAPIDVDDYIRRAV